MNTCTFCGRESDVHDTKVVGGYTILECCTDCEKEIESSNDEETIPEEKMLEYARDLRSDLKYAFESGEGQTPNRKDVLVMDWLIQQTKKVREQKEEIEALQQTSILNANFYLECKLSGEI